MLQLAALALVASVAPTRVLQEGAPDATTSASLRVHGRIVDAAASPVEGVHFELIAEARAPGVAPRPVECDSGADGVFELTLDVAPATAYRLSARRGGFGDLAWRWPNLPPPNVAFAAAPATGRALDLGTVALRPTASLSGFIVDGDGVLQSDGWTVEVEERLGPDVDFWRAPMARTASIDAESGEFEVTDFAAGRVLVTATGDGGRRRATAYALLLPGETNQVELVDTSADPEQRLLLKIRSISPFGPMPDRGTVYALDVEGYRIPLEPQQGGLRWAADGVPRGDYRLVVDDPRFERWEQADVRTGTEVSARLVGSAALTVDVVDEVTGERVEDYELAVEYIELQSSHRTQPLRAAGAPHPPEGRYSGVVPESIVATVLVAGCVPSVVDVAGLAPGEVRPVRFRVGRGVALAGRLLELDGTPLADAEVSVTRGELPGLAPPLGGNSSTGIRTAEGNRSIRVPAHHGAQPTAPDGGFRFEGLSPGRHTLSVVVGTHAIRDWPIDVTEETAAAPIELRMPGRGRLETMLVPRPGVEFERAMLFVTPTGWLEDHTVPPELWPTRTRKARPLADDEGRFPTLELIAGAWDVVVSLEFAAVDREPLSLHFELPALEVPAGEVVRAVVDLEQEWPTRVHLIARAEGLAQQPSGVVLRREGSGPELEQRDYVRGWRRLEGRSSVAPPAETSAETPARAPVEVEEWVVPGTYRVVALDRGWEWTSRETYEVGATMAAPIEVSVALQRGSILVRDEAGEPRPGLALEWWVGETRRESAMPVRTDTRGRFEVVAPEGTLHVAFTREVETDVFGRPQPGWRAKRLGPTVASVEWGAGATPEEPPALEVVIPRAADEGR